jgi:hypothetical protein
MTNPAQTGASDTTYDLASVLYHALHGAQNYEQFVRDAEQAGDQELAQFFREAQTENRQLAERAQELLRRQRPS